MRVIVVLLLASTAAWPLSAQANCDVHAGDDLLAWVNGTAGVQSRQLAQADYLNREQRILMGAQDEHDRLLSATGERLRLALDRIRSFEDGAAALPVLDAAVLRERDAQEVMNELLQLKAILADVQFRQDTLEATPTLDWMKENGFLNVGRATLLASFVKLGDDAAESLRERYSLRFQVTYDDSGHATGSGGINQSQQWDDALAAAVANYYPWGTVAALVYEGMKFEIGQQKCEDKLAEQRQKVRDAFDILPGKLIQPDEQLAYMIDSYHTVSDSLKPVLVASVTLRKELEAEWREAFAFNAARLKVAHTELTADKVQQMQKEYGAGTHLSSLLESAAVTRLADDLGSLNSDLARRQRLVLRSCGNALGAETVEDQIDSLVVARSIYKALLARTTLAPLQPLIAASSTVAGERSAEAAEIKLHLSLKNCLPASTEVLGNATLTGRVTSASLRSFPDTISLLRAESSTARVGWALSNGGQTSGLLSVVGDHQGNLFCELSSTGGGAWSCDGAGPTYDGSFDPRSGPMGGNDGGYAQDERRLQSDINAASKNMGDRIADLKKKSAQLTAALPEWRMRNVSALSGAGALSRARATESAEKGAEFAVTEAAPLAALKQAMDNFLASPFDPAQMENLVRSVGGSEMSLPDVTLDIAVPDLPTVTGVTAADRLFGKTSSVGERRIEREEAKDRDQLADDPPASDLAARETALARLFDAGGTAASASLAGALLLDAKSLRYAKSGEIPHAGFSRVEGDRLSRSDLGADSNLPRNSLLSRADTFRAGSAILDQRVGQLRGSLASDNVYSAPRAALLDTAENLDKDARTLFFTGSLSDGERLQKFAIGVVDLASRFVPGVNWGRDVYEAVSGNDLFNGEPLGYGARTIAVLGAVTFGIAEEADGVVHAIDDLRVLGELRGLGNSGERAHEILEAARTLNAEKLEISAHMIDETRDTLGEISPTEISDAINRGTKWWNSDKMTIVAIEKDAFPGEVRVAACVDFDQKVVTTVYRELKTDEELVAATIGGKGRYIRLTE